MVNVKIFMRFFSVMSLIVLASQAATVFSQQNTRRTTAQIDGNASYRLTNDDAGSGSSLSVSGTAVVMAPTRDSNEQFWKLISLGGDKYRLVNVAVGESKSLDNRKSGDQFLVVMGPTGNYSGQTWTLTSLEDGKYQLSNDFAGAGKSLDSTAMGDSGNYSGQHWALTKAASPIVAPILPNPVYIKPNSQVIVVSPIPGGSIDVTPKPLPVATPSNSFPPISYDNVPILWDPNNIPKGGNVICAADLRTAVRCGQIKADWVGTHQINLKCEKGFYDPIWGGTCWDFPADDQNGNWVRGTTEITADDAVWRAPKESFATARKVKTTPWAGECGEGTFWDGWIGSGSGGAGCYQCPNDHPRRTATPVFSGQACASASNEVGKAVFLNYNGCPAPNRTTMGLQGKRMPGKPFLDLAGGGCYACPNADDSGNIIITERNASPIKGGQGCSISFKWTAPEFPEPGISGLDGVKEILVDNFVLDNPDIVTHYLTGMAEGQGFRPGTPESLNYVKQQWQDIAEHPYKSAALSNLVFSFLENAAQKQPNARTPAEKKLVAAVEEYVGLRRTFIAEQALAMYDAWKAATDKNYERRAQSQTEVLFDYGTVPLDFHAAALAGFGMGAVGASTITALVVSNRYALTSAKLSLDAYNKVRLVPATIQPEYIILAARRAFIAAQYERTIGYGFSGLKVFRALALTAQLMMIGPAVIIEVAGGILVSIAIDQFIKIQEARPKLLSSVSTAKRPVDLRTLLATPDGKDQLAYFWSKAMDGKTIREDGQLTAKARAAQLLAEQSGYKFVAGQ